MSVSTDLIYDIKRKMLAKYPRFGTEIAGANIEYRDDLKYRTASTDGKNIYVDPEFFASLSESDKLFIIAHEVMHIKFMHMHRLKDKNGKMRNFRLWNIATDAIINANLERDGFTIKEGYINMPEALKYSAEEFYQILLKEEQKKKEEKDQEKTNGQNQKGNSGQGEYQENENQEQSEENILGDDHTIWEEAFEEQQNSPKKEQYKNSDGFEKEQEKEAEKELPSEQEENNFNEKGEFEDNRQEKRQKFQSRRQKTEKDIRGIQDETINLGNLGESKEDIDWKLLIRREIDKTEMIWSQRRSIAENNYAYRLEEYELEDEAETEIMIDVSGSVDLKLVKGFLRQIKPLLKQSKIRVGCFNEKFWGFVDVKNVRDIDNFTIPKEARGDSAWTEDWDLAVRSFTKKKEINKFVFTDGYPCPGTMPKEDLKKENVVWLVYGNKEFKPCCGKVINITEKQLEQLHQIEKDIYVEDRSR